MEALFLEAEYIPRAGELARSLHLPPGSGEEGDFFALLAESARPARPRAACRERAGRWYFIATCGGELERAAEGRGVLERFWFEAIMRDALVCAETAAREAVAERSGGAHLAMIGPGSLPGWPIEGQRELFAFMEREAEFCGVRLDGNFVMRPLKSSSGMFVPAEEGWSLCGACPREDCGERKPPAPRLTPRSPRTPPSPRS